METIELPPGESPVDVISGDHYSVRAQHKSVMKIGLWFPLARQIEIRSGGVVGFKNERTGVVDISHYRYRGWHMGNGETVAVFHDHIRIIGEVSVLWFDGERNPATGTGILELRNDRLLRCQHLRKVAGIRGRGYGNCGLADLHFHGIGQLIQAPLLIDPGRFADQLRSINICVGSKPASSLQNRAKGFIGLEFVDPRTNHFAFDDDVL